MYLGVVLAYPLVHKTPLNLAEIVLLALNIAVNSIISYLLIEQAGLDSYHGLLTLLYCLLYLGMGRWIKLALPQEKTVKTLSLRLHLPSWQFPFSLVSNGSLWAGWWRVCS